ncbi:MAG: tetratricopeptide repeat protein, partial [bacterium]|nr:tetratricopeptide repeat protein [bacterium]
MPTLEDCLNLGNKCHKDGTFNQAIDAYKEALTLEPTHAATYINLIKIYLTSNNIKEAFTTCEQFVAIIPLSEKTYWLILANLIQDTLLNATPLFFQQIANQDITLSITPLLEKIDMELIKSVLVKKVALFDDIGLKQNILCQALIPDTLLGHLFYFARQWRKPALQRGTLNSLAKSLDDELRSSNNNLLLNEVTLIALNRQVSSWQITLKQRLPDLYQSLFERHVFNSKLPRTSHSMNQITHLISPPRIEPSAPLMSFWDCSMPPPYNPHAHMLSPPTSLREEPFSLIQELIEHLQNLNSDLSDVNKKYLCHFSKQIMIDPVVAADGYTYDRANIEQW